MIVEGHLDSLQLPEKELGNQEPKAYGELTCHKSYKMKSKIII